MRFRLRIRQGVIKPDVVCPLLLCDFPHSQSPVLLRVCIGLFALSVPLSLADQAAIPL